MDLQKEKQKGKRIQYLAIAGDENCMSGDSTWNWRQRITRAGVDLYTAMSPSLHTSTFRLNRKRNIKQNSFELSGRSIHTVEIGVWFHRLRLVGELGKSIFGTHLHQEFSSFVVHHDGCLFVHTNVVNSHNQNWVLKRKILTANRK